ncbi:hypothetical protein KR018_000508 [Drosophila ironensis]|nr:hypothetical protein KR018_000508 [Drosophila ironensis]
MSSEEESNDKILMDLAKQHRFVLPEFIGSLAGFLHRKTDFFTRSDQDDWEQLLLEIFRKEYQLALASHNEKMKKREEAKNEKKKREEQEALEARQRELANKKICEITDEEAAAITKEEEDKKRLKLLAAANSEPSSPTLNEQVKEKPNLSGGGSQDSLQGPGGHHCREHSEGSSKEVQDKKRQKLLAGADGKSGGTTREHNVRVHSHPAGGVSQNSLHRGVRARPRPTGYHRQEDPEGGPQLSRANHQRRGEAGGVRLGPSRQDYCPYHDRMAQQTELRQSRRRHRSGDVHAEDQRGAVEVSMVNINLEPSKPSNQDGQARRHQGPRSRKA